jgi:hypothetical protein
MRELRNTWEQATANNRRTTGRWDKARNLLTHQGWTQLTHATHTYTTKSRPLDFLEKVKSRSWSSTWDMDDTTHAAGVASVRQAIDELYDGNLEHEIHGEGQFHVTAHRPPPA